MRFFVKVSIPAQAGNADAHKEFSTIQSILEQQKPEAAYFIVEGGKRTALLFLDLDDASQIPAIAEPWFLAFDAGIEMTPAMVAEDLHKAGPAVREAVTNYGNLGAGTENFEGLIERLNDARKTNQKPVGVTSDNTGRSTVIVAHGLDKVKEERGSQPEGQSQGDLKQLLDAGATILDE